MVYNSMKYLSKGLLSSHIVALDLSRARVDCCGVRDLAKVLRYTRISSLNLSSNKIACKGIGYLTDGLVGCRISSLNLSKNRIACQGFKYLIKGCRIESLNLRENLIKDEGAQHFAENLANTDISEIDLCGNMIGSEAAYQLFNSAKQKSMNHIKKDVTKVHLDVKSNDLISHMSSYKYPDCLVQISEPCCREDVNFLINNTYKNLGITKLVLEGKHFSHMLGAFDNISITEYDHSFREPIPRNYSKDHNISQILLNSNIAVLNVNASDCRKLLNEGNLILKLKVIAIKMKIVVFEQLVGYCARGVKSTLINSNVVYLDLSNNKLIGDDFGLLVEVLKGSKIISLNLSNNLLNERSAELLAEVLPLTKIIYIDLYGNRIGYLGYIYLVKAAPKSRVCWLSLGNNNIEERLRENIDLSPYIVPRDDTPIEFQIRYLFRELVSLDSTSEQFEFVVPRDDSVMSINDYPLLLKYLPNYKIHIYDYFYMKSMRRHDIHMLNKVNAFVKDMKHKFNSFIESEMVKLGEKFGYDSFVILVKLCDCLDLSDFVELLLLHRVLYYVDDELNFLHPFIYKMLHKHQLPLYASFEPNKKQQIISYFEKHSDIDCAREIINLLDRL
ncbi:uncharacterized protein LOC111062840 [Nilaparvata lugens]|uniref:uncharacterized protein LOC111062840 n=1 Tax=Nilaparvata lugens TaxID=108931 RepID=UPI00193EB8D5|nr:uncharacterized protein LOC111062840 [Nilaparvata lugens]XP_039278293.1 uncharacterized protein LOC111062840 [Nilaparvata lugens]XP_039278294.1 uncharacterized protein LOC111062840 [Nilaparvata lugens]